MRHSLIKSKLLSVDEVNDTKKLKAMDGNTGDPKLTEYVRKG